MLEVYQAVLALLDAGETGALCTVVASSGSSPRKPGSKMLVCADGRSIGTIGGGAIELAVQKRAANVISTGRAERFAAHLSRELAMCCGGRMEVFIEPVGARPWLFVFGGGHIGTALVRVAAEAGWRVQVIDEREEWTGADRHERADAVRCEAPLDVIDDLPWGPQAAAVVVTHDHALDEQIVGRCLDRDWSYLGMIGSRAKAHRIVQRLRQRGASAERLARVRAPIGVPIGAQEPGEIAVSIVAELVALRRGAEVPVMSVVSGVKPEGDDAQASTASRVSSNAS